MTLTTFKGNDMTSEIKKTIRKLQATLIQIDQGVKVFFNIAQFEKMGLTLSTKIWGHDSTGNKVVVGNKHLLTPKGKKYIEVMV